MRYIVMDARRDGTGDVFTTEHETMQEAVWEGKRQFDNLTEAEKTVRVIIVIESINPDEDAPDHYEGMPVWER